MFHATPLPRRDRTLAPFDAAADEGMANIRFFGARALLVNQEEWIHEVLVRQAAAFRKGPLLSVYAKPLLGRGLLSGPNDLGRRQRRLISPAFAHKKVPNYAASVAAHAARQVAGWQEGDTVEVTQEMISITLGVMGELLLSADLLDASENIGEAITTLMRFAIDAQGDRWRAVRSVPGALRAVLFLNRTLYGRIAARRARGGEAAGEADLLSLLLFARDPETGGPYMDDRLLRDEVMTLFLAGLETTAVGLAWTLYLLARHPEAYARLRAEADAVLSGRLPVADDLPRLPYALQVFKEALRLYPPAYIVARQALEPVTIGPKQMNRGDVLFVSPYVQHRRPEHFPDPLRFDPDRWADADAERRLPSRYAYLPFGGGPHVCIGAHFAFMEAQLVLAHLAQRVVLTLAPGQETVDPEPLFTLRPRGGVWMTVTRRGPEKNRDRTDIEPMRNPL